MPSIKASKSFGILAVLARYGVLGPPPTLGLAARVAPWFVPERQSGNPVGREVHLGRCTTTRTRRNRLHRGFDQRPACPRPLSSFVLYARPLLPRLLPYFAPI